MFKITTFYVLLFYLNGYTQNSDFQFYGNNTKSQTINFKLINNLIVIPLTINHKKLSFILDTGVNHTILFNDIKTDSIKLNNLKRVGLQALGNQTPVEAVVSMGNRFQIKHLISPKENLYVILNNELNISAKMGQTIHGIIGYDLLKNLVVKINYATKKITFSSPKSYQYKKCKKCEILPLEFYRNKPYINASIQIDTIHHKKTKIKLLVDTGGSEGLWLFEGSKKNIVTPKKHFKDFFGEGLSGNIFGNRSKIPEFSLGRFKIPNPTVSFLDTTSTHKARNFKNRNGSIGGDLLKHFTIWVDYPNQKITLKKRGSLKREFFYNMSGLSVVYNGEVLIKEKESQYPKSGTNTFHFASAYKYQFKPSYKIDHVLKGSPADLAGLLKNDIIKKINNNPVYECELSDIIQLFHSKPNKVIKLKVERLGKEYNYTFTLKKRI